MAPLSRWLTQDPGWTGCLGGSCWSSTPGTRRSSPSCSCGTTSRPGWGRSLRPSRVMYRYLLQLSCCGGAGPGDWAANGRGLVEVKEIGVTAGLARAGARRLEVPWSCCRWVSGVSRSADIVLWCRNSSSAGPCDPTQDSDTVYQKVR